MPIVRPPRDLSKVKSVKKYKTRNGEVVHELVVLFDYKEAGLSESVLQGLKEIFLKFDTDKDGVITLDQVQLAIRATGRSLAAKEVAELVKGFSSDEKNCSMEFNEFLKMMATEESKDSRPQEDALLKAFRCFSLDILFWHIPGHLTGIVMGSSNPRSFLES